MSWRDQLREGVAIPLHPLALTSQRRLDERRQRALTRYYLAAGAGGVAVGARANLGDRRADLYQPVLELAMEELRGEEAVKLAAVAGDAAQAVREAECAASAGYDAVLVTPAALPDAPLAEVLDHVRAIAGILPVFASCVQPPAGGRALPPPFWRELAGIPAVAAIRVAPHDRCQTLDVVRAVAASGRAGEIALYSGNPAHLVVDLLTPWRFGDTTVRMAGGLLDHWAVWTLRAARMLEQVREEVRREKPIAQSWLTLAAEITDASAAVRDAAHDYRGAWPGIHEVLRRQGLLEGRWCPDPDRDLSPGQVEEIDRVCGAYPHLQDDAFVQEHLDRWLS